MQLEAPAELVNPGLQMEHEAVNPAVTVPPE